MKFVALTIVASLFSAPAAAFPSCKDLLKTVAESTDDIEAALALRRLKQSCPPDDAANGVMHFSTRNKADTRTAATVRLIDDAASGAVDGRLSADRQSTQLAETTRDFAMEERDAYQRRKEAEEANPSAGGFVNAMRLLSMATTAYAGAKAVEAGDAQSLQFLQLQQQLLATGAQDELDRETGKANSEILSRSAQLVQANKARSRELTSEELYEELNRGSDPSISNGGLDMDLLFASPSSQANATSPSLPTSGGTPSRPTTNHGSTRPQSENMTRCISLIPASGYGNLALRNSCHDDAEVGFCYINAKYKSYECNPSKTTGWQAAASRVKAMGTNILPNATSDQRVLWFACDTNGIPRITGYDPREQKPVGQCN